MTALMTFAQYAEAIGVNPSTISRAVQRGSVPCVELADGRKMIDRAAADTARRRNSNITSGHGGKPDRAERRLSTWKAQRSTGFDPAVRACLNVMQTEWPDLMRRSMALLGADEMNQARAVLVLEELVGCIACTTHSPHNQSRVHDYRDAIETWQSPAWAQADTRAFVAKWGDDGHGGVWMSDEDGMPGGSELMDEMMEASSRAKP